MTSQGNYCFIRCWVDWRKSIPGKKTTTNAKHHLKAQYFTWKFHLGECVNICKKTCGMNQHIDVLIFTNLKWVCCSMSMSGWKRASWSEKLLVVALLQGKPRPVCCICRNVVSRGEFAESQKTCWSFLVSCTCMLTALVQIKNNKSMWLHKSSPVICKSVIGSVTMYFA